MSALVRHLRAVNTPLAITPMVRSTVLVTMVLKAMESRAQVRYEG